jgi:hypothetical protein
MTDEELQAIKMWQKRPAGGIGHRIMEGHRYIDELLDEVKRLQTALEAIRHELGVPQPGYPAPVANAANIATEALGK